MSQSGRSAAGTAPGYRHTHTDNETMDRSLSHNMCKLGGGGGV